MPSPPYMDDKLDRNSKNGQLLWPTLCYNALPVSWIPVGVARGEALRAIDAPYARTPENNW